VSTDSSLTQTDSLSECGVSVVQPYSDIHSMITTQALVQTSPPYYSYNNQSLIGAMFRRPVDTE